MTTLASSPARPAVDALGFTAAMHELQTILDELDGPRGQTVDVDELVPRVSRAQQLHAHCQRILAGARAEITALLDGPDPVSAPK